MQVTQIQHELMKLKLIILTPLKQMLMVCLFFTMSFRHYKDLIK